MNKILDLFIKAAQGQYSQYDNVGIFVYIIILLILAYVLYTGIKNIFGGKHEWTLGI